MRQGYLAVLDVPEDSDRRKVLARTRVATVTPFVSRVPERHRYRGGLVVTVACVGVRRADPWSGARPTLILVTTVEVHQPADHCTQNATQIIMCK